jgi:hypothetical protein
MYVTAVPRLLLGGNALPTAPHRATPRILVSVHCLRPYHFTWFMCTSAADAACSLRTLGLCALLSAVWPQSMWLAAGWCIMHLVTFSAAIAFGNKLSVYLQCVYFPPPQWVRRGADAVRYGLQGLIIIISVSAAHRWQAANSVVLQRWAIEHVPVSPVLTY